MVHKSDSGPSALEASTFGGRMPTGSGDLAIETHGITPVPEDHRYGTPRRLFTVWFAPQMTMTGVFTGTLAIALGLGFWLGLGRHGHRHPAGLAGGGLPVDLGAADRFRASCRSRGWPSVGGVVIPAALQWLSSIAWDGLVGLFGGEALSVLLGIPFWSAVLIVLACRARSASSATS